MDRTKLFVATVKAIRLRERDTRNYQEKLKTKPSSLFFKEAYDVYTKIRKLKEFLMACRKDYIDHLGFLGMKAAMSDDERDRIDSDVKEFIQTCVAHISKIKNLITSGSSSCEAVLIEVGPQLHEHRYLVCQSLNDLLKGTCRLYDEQRKVRVNKIISRKKMGRLQSNIRRQNNSPEARTADTCPSTSVAVTGESDVVDLSTEEQSQFATENQQLFSEVSSMTSEIRLIEGKVIEISKLQEMFAENILQQVKQVDDIAGKTEASHENITSGSDQIRKAIKSKATFRVWILFILIVCSVALLFLDWYS